MGRNGRHEVRAGPRTRWGKWAEKGGGARVIKRGVHGRFALLMPASLLVLEQLPVLVRSLLFFALGGRVEENDCSSSLCCCRVLPTRSRVCQTGSLATNWACGGPSLRTSRVGVSRKDPRRRSSVCGRQGAHPSCRDSAKPAASTGTTPREVPFSFLWVFVCLVCEASSNNYPRPTKVGAWGRAFGCICVCGVCVGAVCGRCVCVCVCLSAV